MPPLPRPRAVPGPAHRCCAAGMTTSAFRCCVRQPRVGARPATGCKKGASRPGLFGISLRKVDGGDRGCGLGSPAHAAFRGAPPGPARVNSCFIGQRFKRVQQDVDPKVELAGEGEGGFALPRCRAQRSQQICGPIHTSATPACRWVPAGLRLIAARARVERRACHSQSFDRFCAHTNQLGEYASLLTMLQHQRRLPHSPAARMAAAHHG
eukprot:250502-Chlamydomonas_euryale.AAC.24